MRVIEVARRAQPEPLPVDHLVVELTVAEALLLVHVGEFIGGPFTGNTLTLDGTKRTVTHQEDLRDGLRNIGRALSAVLSPR